MLKLAELPVISPENKIVVQHSFKDIQVGEISEQLSQLRRHG
jgi:hypothetical protein